MPGLYKPPLPPPYTPATELSPGPPPPKILSPPAVAPKLTTPGQAVLLGPVEPPPLIFKISVDYG